MQWTCSRDLAASLPSDRCISLHFDGSSDLTNGVAAGGIVIGGASALGEAGFFMQEATNNESEYAGSLLGLN